MLTRRTLMILMIWVAEIHLLRAQSPAPPGAEGQPPLREITPGVFGIGQVKFDKALRTIRFPAVLNMENSIVEYLLVTEGGKIHESVLRTAVEPAHLQLAFLLLGAKGAGTNNFLEMKATEIPGDKLGIDVSWETTGGPKKVPAEQLVWSRHENAVMSKGPWVYTGSRVWEGLFLAQQEGSIISLIVDPIAMVNNPRPGADDDESWLVNTNGLPALNSPVEVTLRLTSPRTELPPK